MCPSAQANPVGPLARDGSTGFAPRRRHRAEQSQTWSQFFAHDFRQVIVRPHTAHVFSSGGMGGG